MWFWICWDCESISSWFLKRLVHRMKKFTLCIYALYPWIISLVILEKSRWFERGNFIHCIIVIIIEGRLFGELEWAEVKFSLWRILKTTIHIRVFSFTYNIVWMPHDILFRLTRFLILIIAHLRFKCIYLISDIGYLGLEVGNMNIIILELFCFEEV